MNDRPHTQASISITTTGELRAQAAELVMAWAADIATGELRYIMELDAERRGAKSGCVCIHCKLPLQAVNAGKTEWRRRPHFRHPEGAQKDACIILTARDAIRRLLNPGDLITLPGREVGARIEGFSGAVYDARAISASETVCITDVQLWDGMRAVLRLDDGRELEVQLVGSTEISDRASEGVRPLIMIAVDDPHIAGLPPEELRKRLVPLLMSGTWCGHWADAALQAEALDVARVEAEQALDWAEEDLALPEDMRRESLLHRLVKQLLENAGRLNVPGWTLREPRTGLVAMRQGWIEILQRAVLEQRLGRIIPDVIVTTLHSGEILIEVTVTNKLTDERIKRIRSLQLPALEIDLSVLGGRVSRDDLNKLVIFGLVGKRWLYHPEMQAEYTDLMATADEQLQRRHEAAAKPYQPGELREAQNERVLRKLRDTMYDEPRPATPRATASDEQLVAWTTRYFQCFDALVKLKWEDARSPAQRKQELKFAQDDLQECIDALSEYGYPEARDPRLYSDLRILERLLSILRGEGVGSTASSAWPVLKTIIQDANSDALGWHTLYLMAEKTFAPALMPMQRWDIDEWRLKVRKSLEAGELTYQRDPSLDRFFALLFPELADALDKPFGRRATPATLPPELTQSYFKGVHEQRWLWAQTGQQRITSATIELRRPQKHRRHEIILQHIARPGIGDPWSCALQLEHHLQIPREVTLAFLYSLGLTIPMQA